MLMGPDDFFEETEMISPWTNSPTTTTKLRRAFLKELSAGRWPARTTSMPQSR